MVQPQKEAIFDESPLQPIPPHPEIRREELERELDSLPPKRVGFVQLALGISSPGEVVIRRGVTALRQVQQEIRKRTKGTAALLDAAVRAAIDAGRR